jgi:plasmid stability protein
MRTTLTLDDDVADELRARAHRSRRSFKQVVNDALRAGLQSQTRPRPRRYRLTPASLGGARPGFDLDKALRLADALEDEGIARKLELRK